MPIQSFFLSFSIPSQTTGEYMYVVLRYVPRRDSCNITSYHPSLARFDTPRPCFSLRLCQSGEWLEWNGMGWDGMLSHDGGPGSLRRSRPVFPRTPFFSSGPAGDPFPPSFCSVNERAAAAVAAEATTQRNGTGGLMRTRSCTIKYSLHPVFRAKFGNERSTFGFIPTLTLMLAVA